jgi:NAD(P)H-dependent FMN reductase
MGFLIISASLNSHSKSRLLADVARKTLSDEGVAHQRLDLRDVPLPFCDGEAA